jgi:hypothetical protein
MSNQDKSSSGLSLPQDLSLPLFVYGSLKPGMPAFESISKLILDSPESAQVVGALYLRDGLPLLFLDGSKKIKGYVLKFDPEKSGYEQVCAFEPKTQYQWTTFETTNGLRVNLLTGKKIQQGNAVESDFSDWQLKDDLAFGQGLPVVRSVMNEIIANKQWTLWEKFFRSQMAYLLLWSIVERMAALCIGPNVNPTQRVNRLHNLRGMNALIEKHVKRRDWVSDSRDPTITIELNSKNPSDSFKYYYQVRSNLSHRGKAVPNELEKVEGSLPELLNITEDYLRSLQNQENLS